MAFEQRHPGILVDNVTGQMGYENPVTGKDVPIPDPSSVAITGGTMANVAVSGGKVGQAVVMQALPKWQAAVNAARNNTRTAKLLVLGDSNVAGEGCGTGGLGLIGARNGSMAVRAITKINGRVSKASVDTFMGDQNVTAGSVTAAQYDPRITLGSWASDAAANQIIGGKMLTVPGISVSDLVFTPAGAFDRFTVYYPTNTGVSSAVTVKVDTVSVGTLNQSTAQSFASTTFSTTLATHTIGFANTIASPAYIAGVICWSSADPGIVLIHGGNCGVIASGLAATGQAWNPIASMSVYQPDLTVINCSINDCELATAVATYQTNIDALVVAAQLYGDAIICCGFPSSGAGTTNGLLDSYFTALRAIGTARGVSVIDLRDTLGSTYTIANTRGYAFDTKHPNIGGHYTIGGIMADACYVP